jgi:hypothetical protein
MEQIGLCVSCIYFGYSRVSFLTGMVDWISACSGGNQTHWPFGGSLIQYRQANAVFLPAVLPPTPGAAKTEPTRLSSNRVRVFSLTGGDLSWSLPRSWVGKSIESTTLTPMGAESGPVVKVIGDRLSLSGVPAALPVILTMSAPIQ